jgi:hypothetical protein
MNIRDTHIKLGIPLDYQRIDDMPAKLARFSDPTDVHILLTATQVRISLTTTVC